MAAKDERRERLFWTIVAFMAMTALACLVGFMAGLQTGGGLW